VVGPLYHYADEIHEVCGCSSYQQIRADMALARAAKADGRISAALFDHDSPGGQVDGCAECADDIAALSAEMPTASYSRALMCSASYWLGSAVGAGNVYAAKVALVGSIGVAAAYRAGGRCGPSVVEIVSSQSPNKRPDVGSEKGRAQLQSMVDDMAQVFVESVAAHRGVSVETVLADFGPGGVFIGGKAVTAGLADRVGSFETVLVSLAERGRAASGGTTAVTVPAAIFTPTEGTMSTAATPAAPAGAALTAEQVRQQHPAAATEIATAAATAERTRIKSILAEADTEDERTAVMPLLDQPAATDGDAAKAIRAAQREKGAASGAAAAAYRDRLKADEADLDAPAANADAAPADSEAAQAMAIINAGRPLTPSKN
jgi:ClpP class serine protease